MATTWSHRAARVMVRPLLGTGVTPNHLTTLRVLTGLGAFACLTVGTRSGNLWGGLLWILSAFLDRADGELARIGQMSSPNGHLFDFIADTACNVLFFVGAGIGLRSSWLGGYGPLLGVLAGAGIGICWVVGEIYQSRSAPGTRIWTLGWGFDADDGLYLLGPLAMLNWLAPTLILSTAVLTIFAVLAVARLATMKRAVV
jgi:phosphatidylglycerophosphate synthase